jgi:hypothetical protein
MADDPERDIVPVREGASCEKQRDGSNFSLSGEKGNDCMLISYLYKLLTFHTIGIKYGNISLLIIVYDYLKSRWGSGGIFLHTGGARLFGTGVSNHLILS